MIRLVCIDVDGTLLGVSGVVHPAVWEAVAAARAAGIRLALSSGRPGFGITRELAHRVEPDGWHSFQNGASIVHLNGGGSLSEPLPPEWVATLIERARRHDRPLELYSDDHYVTESTSARAQRHARLLGIPFAPGALEDVGPPIVRAQWLLDHGQGDEVLLERHTGLEVSPSLAPAMPDTLFISLTRAGIHKGSAVQAIAARYGIGLESVMYVGDGFNDTPAMSIVGLPVAVANAEPVARAVAKVMVRDADAGGLADALHLALDSLSAGR